MSKLVQRMSYLTTCCILLMGGVAQVAQAQELPDQAKLVRENYTKQEQMVPVRDGVKLFTSIYTPKDTQKKVPIIMIRTPYSVRPYGEAYRTSLGPSNLFAKEGYIFVYQDVRGRFMSEGEFENMRPHLAVKKSKTDIDESTDTYDTIDWLLQNIPNHNGRVGMWGISYPGFYASAGMIDAHPALKAVSPQAPIGDWFFDDFHHHGAFFLPHSFNFMAGFGRPRPKPTTEYGGPRFQHGTPDGYQFFLDLGSLKNADERYFKGNIAYWNTIAEHPNYDAFWQARNILPHLKKAAPAVMTVGGWYDAEDLYGALKTYRSIEEKNPAIFNMLVMGPWRHGGWSRGEGEKLGNVAFGSKTSIFYRENIELPFFQHHLRGEGELKHPEAYAFETGKNQWRTFEHWPPRNLESKSLHCQANEGLTFEPAVETEAFDEFVSDPKKPVPFTEAIAIGMTSEYMTDDQRFAARRPDVLVYQTPVLNDDVTLAGPLLADMWVSTTGTDADWIVKLIDVLPNDAPDPMGLPLGRRMGGYQMMVRSEVIRGRFRDSYEHPKPFEAGKPTQVKLELQDVLHTFQKGHRIMIQIQSTWFPLVDRNPQKYVDNIFFAKDTDFMKATHRVHRSKQRPTQVNVGVLR